MVKHCTVGLEVLKIFLEYTQPQRRATFVRGVKLSLTLKDLVFKHLSSCHPRVCGLNLQEGGEGMGGIWEQHQKDRGK